MPRYVLVSTRPDDVREDRERARTAMAQSPAASPSRPSVRFTALLVPVRMNVTNATYSQPSQAAAVTMNMYL